MNRREFFTASALLLTACASEDDYTRIVREVAKEEYEKLQMHRKIREIESIKKIVDSMVLLNTTTRYKIPSKDDLEHELISPAIGVVYKDFLLTVDHAVSVYTIKEQSDTKVKEIKIDKHKEITTTSSGVPLETIVRDKENDIAVFRVPYNYDGRRYPFELGDSDKTEVGQEVLFIGNPNVLGFSVREGIIASKVFIHSHVKHPGFYVSITPVPGDSGGLVVDRNTFSLLGLNSKTITGQGYMVPINLFKPYLK